MDTLKQILAATCLMPAVLAGNVIAQGNGTEGGASYAGDLAAYQAKRAQQTGPKLGAADRAIMKRATADLAAAMPDPGLSAGEQAPDFELRNAFGKPVRLYSLLEQGPVVLSFYRGAWCPYCNLQLRGLQRSLPQIERLGARLVAVTPQLPDKSLTQVKADGYRFEILSDLDSKVMQAYRLYFEVPEDLSEVYQRNFQLDLAEYNGPGRYLLPVPGTFIIDRRGIVRAAFSDVDYTRRMEPRDIIDALARIEADADAGNTVQ